MKYKPKVAVDLHGTAIDYPDLFQPLMMIGNAVGVEIIILSGPPLKQIEEELHAAKFRPGIHFTKIISVVDWLRQKGTPMYCTDKGHWFTKSEEDWWASKARICGAEKIDVLIDDLPEYEKYFNDIDTMFILWRPMFKLAAKEFKKEVEAIHRTRKYIESEEFSTGTQEHQLAWTQILSTHIQRKLALEWVINVERTFIPYGFEKMNRFIERVQNAKNNSDSA